MGYLLWILHLLDILPQFQQLLMQYLTILGCVKTALDCIGVLLFKQWYYLYIFTLTILCMHLSTLVLIFYTDWTGIDTFICVTTSTAGTGFFMSLFLKPSSLYDKYDNYLNIFVSSQSDKHIDIPFFLPDMPHGSIPFFPNWLASILTTAVMWVRLAMIGSHNFRFSVWHLYITGFRYDYIWKITEWRIYVSYDIYSYVSPV